MKQKKIDDILYVYSLEPYVITEDTDAEIIYVQEELIEKYKELNPSITSFAKINYNLLSVTTPEYLEYRFEPDPEPTYDFYFSQASLDVYNSGVDGVSSYLVNTGTEPATFSSTNPTVAVDPYLGTLTFSDSVQTTIVASNGELTTSMTVYTHYTQPEPTKSNLSVTTYNPEMQIPSGSSSYSSSRAVILIPTADNPNFVADVNDWDITLPAGSNFTASIDSFSPDTGGSILNVYFSVGTSDIGSYTIDIIFKGNEYYYNTSFSTTLTISQETPTPTPTKSNLEVEAQSLNLSANSTKSSQNVLKIPNTSVQGFTYNASEWSITYGEGLSGTGAITTSGGSTLSIKTDIVTPAYNGTYNITVNFTGNNDFYGNTYTTQVTIYGGQEQPKQNPSASWQENGNNIMNTVVREGDTTVKNLTFSATPSDSWTFMNPMVSGITLDTTTGAISIDPTNMIAPITTAINANRNEDSTYYSAYASVTIYVISQSADADFFFGNDNLSLTNNMPNGYTNLINNTGLQATYTSNDTSVCTVDNYGQVTYVGPGTTTVTATAGTHSATLNVTCTFEKKTLMGNAHETINAVVPANEDDVQLGTITLVTIPDYAMQGYTFDSSDFDVFERGGAKWNTANAIVSGSDILVQADCYAEYDSRYDTSYYEIKFRNYDDFYDNTWTVSVNITKESIIQEPEGPEDDEGA